ncbi:MAG: 1-deoxy-D-xylulose-5-phosphate synthase [Eggerthellaceae bacterium]|nr:1-deoxy-D-xylulose-5-phosphate synthase [Eggerthellaceae bacterium]
MEPRILDVIQSPADLKVLSDEDLTILADEIRDQIIASTSEHGGHVASSLGAVEIILAVHSMIDSPKDRFVFDVGHQAYAHKMITGRLAGFDHLRELGGISGFPKPNESPHDVHPSGHASDSLSIAAGLAKARDLRGGDEKIVVLIGDASIAGGMAFEALNSIGQMNSQLTIVLNDNEMSISHNVGGLMHHLGALRASNAYRQTRDYVSNRIEDSNAAIKAMAGFGWRAKESMKQFFLPQAMLFEQLGITCTPPIDGHDIVELRRVLKTALSTNGPVLVHACTKKGAGYAPAENSPEIFHGVGPFDIKTGEQKKKAEGMPLCFTEVFGAALIKEARANEDIIALTAAMSSGTGLSAFEREFPDRFLDGGIAEGHVVGTAAGLALGGKKPVVAIYSTFLQRAIDQMIVDVALCDSDVVFCIDRAGVVGEDGPTHHGIFDLAYTRMIPNMRVLAPSDEAELVNSLHTALAIGGPVAIRYPRGAATGAAIPDEASVFPLGVSRTVREGDDVAILAFGDMVARSVAAAEILEGQGISARVVDMRWVKPLDANAIADAAKTKLIVTVEDGIVAGGAGEGVVAELAAQGLSARTVQLGIDDCFVAGGSVNELLATLELDPESIAHRILTSLENE